MVARMRVALLVAPALLSAALSLRAQPAGDAPARMPGVPPGWTVDLAPAPPEPPPSMAEAQRQIRLPGLAIEPFLPGEDRRLPMSDLFGDGHSLFYGGELLEEPARGRRLGGAATIPF